MDYPVFSYARFKYLFILQYIVGRVSFAQDFTWEKIDMAEILKKEAGKISKPEHNGTKVPLDGE